MSGFAYLGAAMFCATPSDARARVPAPPPPRALAQTRACALDARTRVLRNSKSSRQSVLAVGSWPRSRWLVALLRHLVAPLCVFLAGPAAVRLVVHTLAVGDVRSAIDTVPECAECYYVRRDRAAPRAGQRAGCTFLTMFLT